jgi:hypothetical protein
MPDETVEQPVAEPVAEPEPTPEPTEEQVEVPEVEPEKPHPLSPGGPRFEQVYREKEDYRREADYLRGENERLRSSQQQPQPQKPQEAWFTAEQLQAYVDRGQITPAKAAEQLAWQQAQLAQREMLQTQATQSRLMDAGREVNQYKAKIPALNNPTSSEMLRVKEAVYEVAADMGLPANDLRVQRRALRETFGSLEKLTKTSEVREVSRRSADTHAETSSTAGGNRAPSKDPLATVPQRYKDHWKRMGYTQQQMAEEAKYIRQRPTK